MVRKKCAVLCLVQMLYFASYMYVIDYCRILIFTQECLGLHERGKFSY